MDDVTKNTNISISSLDMRLRRIEYVLAGSYEYPEHDLQTIQKVGVDYSINTQISDLDRNLTHLMNKSKTVKEILDLHLGFPEIFRNSQSFQTSSSTLTPSEKASAILFRASDYHSTSSQLTAIMDTALKDLTESAEFISLLPRIQKSEVVQQVQASKVAELRVRTAALLEQWFLIGIESANDCLAEWDVLTFDMNKNLTRKLRRAEAD